MGILKQLMVTLNSDIFQPKSTKQRILVEPSLSFWKTIYKIFWSMAVSALFFWSVFPILDKSVKDYRLPFLAWYPYNTKVSPSYEITYVYQIASISFIAVVNSNIDTLIAALNMYIGTQFDILCDDFRNFHNFSQCAAISVNDKFINCLLHHKKILSFAANTNNCFDWIIFLQFFTSAISIALTMFQLTVVVPLSNEFYSLLSFGNAILVEIFMYCWFGN
ncbi:7tm 6 domain containing protein, partial [Asbolus verrucosus]